MVWLICGGKGGRICFRLEQRRLEKVEDSMSLILGKVVSRMMIRF